MRRPSKERERERDRGGGSRTTPDLNRHKERVARVAVASPLPRDGWKDPWCLAMETLQKIRRRAASIIRPDRSFIEIKVFFFFSKRYLLRKLFHFEEEIVDERKEKFVVYGAVGIDDAGSFFFTTRPAIGIGIHLEGPS